MSRIGSIKWFDTKKGYGFLTDIENNNDVFVHYSSIKTNEEVYKVLYEGEYVSYTHKLDDQKRTVTDNVTGVNGGKLLCENDFFKKLHSNRRVNRGGPRVSTDNSEKDDQ